jgi:hypothetical protein
VLNLLIDSLAVHRATRILTEDRIGEPVRMAIWRRFPSDHGIGYAVSCRYCASVWIAGAVTATHAKPLKFLRPIVYALAAADLTAILADNERAPQASIADITEWARRAG